MDSWYCTHCLHLLLMRSLCSRSSSKTAPLWWRQSEHGRGLLNHLKVKVPHRYTCWHDQGNKLLSFEQKGAKFAVPPQHFYDYLQVSHFINSLGLIKAQPITSAIDSFLLQCKHNKKIISHFYWKLQSLNWFNSNKIEGLWHRDLATEFGEEAWSDAIASIRKIFLCNRLRANRILHRLQRTPQSLNAFCPEISPLCGRLDLTYIAFGAVLGEFYCT